MFYQPAIALYKQIRVLIIPRESERYLEDIIKIKKK